MDVSYRYNDFYDHLGDPNYNWEMRITLNPGKSCQVLFDAKRHGDYEKMKNLYIPDNGNYAIGRYL